MRRHRGAEQGRPRRRRRGSTRLRRRDRADAAARGEDRRDARGADRPRRAARAQAPRPRTISRARPSHHDARGRARPRRFRYFHRRPARDRRSRGAGRAGSPSGARRTTCCASRASSTSRASRCGCWCRASAHDSAASSTARGAQGEARAQPAGGDRREGHRPRRAIAAGARRRLTAYAMHIARIETRIARRDGRGGRSRPDAGRCRVSVLLRQRSPRSRAPATRAPRTAADAAARQACARCAIRCRSISMSSRCARSARCVVVRCSAAWIIGATASTSSRRSRARAALSWRSCLATRARIRGWTRPRRSARPMRRAYLALFRRGRPRQSGGLRCDSSLALGARRRRAAGPRPVPPSAATKRACLRARAGRAAGADRLLSLDLSRADVAPIDALAEALAARGLRRASVYVTSLKDEAALGAARAPCSRADASTSCSTRPLSRRARRGRGGVARRADAPVLQVVLAGARRGVARLDARPGAGRSRDECRAAGDRRADADARRSPSSGEARATTRLEFARDRARAARATASLSSPTSPAPGRACAERPARRSALACVLSDYPGARRARRLCRRARHAARAWSRSPRRCGAAGYDVAGRPRCGRADRSARPRVRSSATLSLAEYEASSPRRRPRFRRALCRRLGRAGRRPRARAARFVSASSRRQADRRGAARSRRRATRKGDYHDLDLPPRHAYVAFYLWLRARRASTR